LPVVSFVELEDEGHSQLLVISKMASGNKHPLAVPADLHCFRCKCHLTVEKDTGNSLQNTQSNSTSQELENLHEDTLELNKVLNVAKRCSVKDAILAEINLISAKIDSLQVPTAA
jgi:hypothetical protein